MNTNLDTSGLSRANNNIDKEYDVNKSGRADNNMDASLDVDRLGQANKNPDTKYDASGANNTPDVDRANNLEKK